MGQAGPLSKKRKGGLLWWMRPNNKKKAKSEEKRERERVGRRRREDELEMDGSGAAAGNHSGNALRHGKRSVLHSQSCTWQSNLSVLFSLLSIFFIGSLCEWYENCFSLSTSETICGMWRWSEGTRSLSSKPLPPINIVSLSLGFLRIFSRDCEF